MSTITLEIRREKKSKREKKSNPINSAGPQGGDAYDIELSLTKMDVYAQVGPGWVS